MLLTQDWTHDLLNTWTPPQEKTSYYTLTHYKAFFYLIPSYNWPLNKFVGNFQGVSGPDVTDWVIALIGGAKVWIDRSWDSLGVRQGSVGLNSMTAKSGSTVKCHWLTRCVVKHKCPRSRQIPKTTIIIQTQDQCQNVKIQGTY
jgi:hypothetical protein